MSDSSSGSSFFTGFLMGAVVGAVLGIMFAPRPGRETRDLWRDRLGDAKLKAMDVVDEIRDEVEEVKEKAEATLESRKPGEGKAAKPA
ncbi:MAG: YtxH domain-containing protein [Chloroflexota bacterium]